MTKSNITLDWEIRGIPLWLIRDYLLELGGKEEEPGWVKGSDWSVSLNQIADYQFGSIRVGQVHLYLKATSDVFETIRQALKKKLIRAGG
ncbi:MAG: hypothetical protein PHD58_02015 [Anaerolineales bacterium]|nr:hypothetical protein [Anaerolineales bacterium]